MVLSIASYSNPPLLPPVHGCLDEFIALLVKCNFDPNADQLVLVGDLVNKCETLATVFFSHLVSTTLVHELLY